MAGFATTLRGATLLAVGVLTLHELRYRVEHGEAAGAVLSAHGHGYLALTSAIVLVLAAAGIWHATRRFAAGDPASGRISRAPGWLRWSAAIGAVHSLQELAEGLFAAGHPDGLAALAGNGGAVALVGAVALGALVALSARGADEVAALRPAGLVLIARLSHMAARARDLLARPVRLSARLAPAPRPPPVPAG